MLCMLHYSQVAATPVTHGVCALMLLWCALPGAVYERHAGVYASHPDITAFFKVFGTSLNPYKLTEALMGYTK